MLPAAQYHVRAREERFAQRGRRGRRNEIWRTVVDRRTGNRMGEELLRTNCALVKYVPVDVPIHEVR